MPKRDGLLGAGVPTTLDTYGQGVKEALRVPFGWAEVFPHVGDESPTCRDGCHVESCTATIVSPEVWSEAFPQIARQLASHSFLLRKVRTHGRIVERLVGGK